MESIRYITSLLTFYLKGEIALEQNFVKFKKPNTILYLIPLGAKKETVPINQLSMVESDFKLKFSNLLWGIIIAILGIVCFGDSFLLGLITLLIGANMALTAFQTVVTVTLTSGNRKVIPFFVFEKAKAELAERNINALIGGRLDDTNTRQQTDRIVDAINNK